MLNIDNIIWCSRWFELADYHYTGQDSLPEGIVCIDVRDTPEFFNRIKGTGKRYTLISCRNDFGLCEQRYNHPALDLIKWAQMQIDPISHGYNDLYMQARLNKDKCDPHHRFSIKCYSFTHSTFNDIPDEINKWYISNNCINDDPRIITIPFGIHEADKDLSCVHKLIGAANSIDENNRTNCLYANWQFYTYERYELYNFLKSCNINNNRLLCERDQSFETYLNRLATFKFIICPIGNGWDSYRMLETLYMGATPVLLDHPSLIKKSITGNVPMVIVNDFKDLIYNIDRLDSIKYNARTNIPKWCDWQYWKSMIRSEV